MLSSLSSSLKPLFKSLNNTKLNTLTKAITCVALGIRVCHLVDITHLDLKKAELLLTQLRKNSFCRSLVLLQFKDRYTFICNKLRLKQHIEYTLNQSELVYISVDNIEPVKVDQPNQLVDWLKYKLSPFISSQEHVFYSTILPTCMVAMTGWILEYPIIYTTHDSTDKFDDELDEWEQRSNCLGNQPLQLIEYYLSDHMLLSYSYPITTILDNYEFVTQLKMKIDKRLDDLTTRPDWLNNIHCEIKREQIKLDRFAL